MRVLCLTSSYPRTESDIAGHFVREFNEILVAANHSVQTLAWRGEGALEQEHLRFVPYAPPMFETLFFQSGAPENLSKRINQILVGPAMLAMWRAIVKERKPDLIIGHWALPGGILARLAGHFFGVPSLVIGHSGGLHRLKNMQNKSIIKALVLDGPITVPSTAFFDVAPKAIFFPIGFHPVQAPSDFSGFSEDALIMSRLEPIKNIRRAILGWHSKTAILHIAGEGSCRKPLEDLAKRLGKNVRFHGLVTGQKKIELMSAVKYFFLPSQILAGRHEGFPIGLLQAIDFGLVPLVANFPGANDILPDTFLVNEGDDWKTRFESLVVSDCVFKELQARVFERRWSQIGSSWLDLINGIVESNCDPDVVLS